VSVTTFLSNQTLWQTLSARVKAARHVDAAIAYFGSGGAKLLPLKRGHRLIVDMSMPTVRAGGTNPREIEKLIKRGVKAFTRRNLHAKLVIADGWAMSGSANISKHSQQTLDEAAILSNDSAVVRRSREFIDRLCIEPIRPEYLRECKRCYRPPRFSGQPLKEHGLRQRATHAKLWLVNLVESSIPEAEMTRFERGEAKAGKLLRDEMRSRLDSFHWPSQPKMATEMEKGDWIIQVVTYRDKKIVVDSPGQLLCIDNYVRDRTSGKRRWVFHLELPGRGQTMAWSEFRRKARRILRTDQLAKPRTKAIRDIAAADGLLRLWTTAGRVSRR
jgi:hypothetical protein